MLSLLGKAHSEESHRSEFDLLMFKVNNLFNNFFTVNDFYKLVK